MRRAGDCLPLSHSVSKVGSTFALYLTNCVTFGYSYARSMDTNAIIKYFGLNEHPFMTSPDPRFLHFSRQVKEALAKCEFMARDRIGPIYMYGPIGSGKTSLVRRLQEKLSQDERYNVKLLVSPNLKSSNAFVRLILETFDVKTERSYAASLANFEEFLVKQYQENKVPVLLIDEGQYLKRTKPSSCRSCLSARRSLEQRSFIIRSLPHACFPSP